MKKSRRILITGNHHTPAIELIHQLQTDKNYDWDICYVAHKYASETHLSHTISHLGVKFFELNSGKYNRHHFLPNLLTPFLFIKSLFQSRNILKNTQPDIIVSFGGYTSVPIIIASRILKITTITHEQTTTLSLSTKINTIFANKVALSFPNPKLSNSKYIVTGNLIRQEILKNISTKYQNMDLDKPLLYVTGGNQGAHFINEQIFKNLEILKDYTIIHQTGVNDIKYSLKFCSLYPDYYPTDYVNLEDIGWVFNHSSLIISRSGANTCQEIDLLDKKAILIPLPNTQQNEQVLNARWLQERHPQTITIFDQQNFNSKQFLNSVRNLINLSYSSKPQKINTPHPLVKLIHEMV